MRTITLLLLAGTLLTGCAQTDRPAPHVATAASPAPAVAQTIAPAIARAPSPAAPGAPVRERFSAAGRSVEATECRQAPLRYRFVVRDQAGAQLYVIGLEPAKALAGLSDNQRPYQLALYKGDVRGELDLFDGEPPYETVKARVEEFMIGGQMRSSTRVPGQIANPPC